MTDRELMQQALEALEYMHEEKCEYMRRNKLGDPLRENAARFALPAITALRERLAQPEQELVMKRIKTWSERCEEHPDHQQGMISEGMIRARMQEEIDELRQALETEQEPVALETVYDTIIHWDETDGKRSRRELARRIVALYTTPPRCPNCASLEAQNTELDAKLAGREWVGLTEEERSYYLQTASNIGWWKAAEILEAKLRHKNTVRMRRATREEKIDNPGVYWVEDKE